MSNEFRPGHPVVFWVTMVLLVFAIFSGAKAGVTAGDCVDEDEQWIVTQVKWKCGDSGIALTD